MDNPPAFGDWLRRRRRELDLTQEALAGRVGCARVTIRKLEAEEIRPSRQLAELLAEKLDLPPQDREAFVRLARGSGPAQVAEPPPPSPRHNLPIHPSSFIGRERELEGVQHLLGQGRLVTLTGPGGTGKTRLALQTATALLRSGAYPDGVWWVELAALQSPSLVGQAVAKAAGVNEIPNQPMLDTLAQALREQHTLLVLDTCEHLIAACAELAERLLRAAPCLTLLATSREALDIAGEATWPVPALALPEPGAALAMHALSQNESVRLFTERAQAVKSSFELAEPNAPAVIQICRRLSGMPLAIELAAARAKMMSVDEIARRLDDRFALLTAGSRTALPRQQTLRATLDWSFDLLSEAERVLFRRLSVFAGGFSLAAAEAVTAGGPISTAQVVDLLGQLINKSLVTVSEPAPESAAETRYGMLETILDYARQKSAEAGEAEDTRARHVDYFATLAAQAEQGINSLEQAAWFRRLDEDVDNLRAALSWQPGQAVDDATRRRSIRRQLLIVGSLPTYWERGHQQEIIAAMEPLLRRDDASQPSRERAKALSAGGVSLWSSNRLLAARACLEESIQIAEALADTWTLVVALGFLGWTLDFLEDYAAAQAALERAVAVGRGLGDAGQHVIGTPLSLLGDIPYQRGDLAGARQLYEASIAYLRAIYNPNFLTYPLRRLGYVALAEGQLGQAAEFLGESLEINWAIGHLLGTCACLAGFANLRLAQGRAEAAARLCGCVEAHLERSGAPLYRPDAADYTRCVARLQAAPDAANYSAAWAAGRSLSLAEAVRDTLNDDQ